MSLSTKDADWLLDRAQLLDGHASDVADAAGELTDAAGQIIDNRQLPPGDRDDPDVLEETVAGAVSQLTDAAGELAASVDELRQRAAACGLIAG